MPIGSWFTPEEDAHIRAGVIAGKYRRQIGVELGRSGDSITRRMKILGLRAVVERKEYPAHLKALIARRWDEGLSTAAIGRELGITKNAAVGKIHRMDLPKRPSPIIRGDDPAKRTGHGKRLPPPCAAVTLPPLVSLSHVMCAPPAAPIVRLVQAVQPAPRPVLVEAFGPPVAPRPRSQCCWPMGEPGTRAFRYCDEDVFDRGPYCAECRKRAFAKTAPPYVREAA